MSLLIKSNLDTGIAYVVDGITGVAGYMPAPFGGTITAVELESDNIGDIQVDIWKKANGVPAVSDTICGGNKPALVGAQRFKDTALTGWTVVAGKGDVFAFNVDSVAVIERCTVILHMVKS